MRFGIFDEILFGSRAINVPEDATWTWHTDSVDISITAALSPGTYDLYAKIGERVISPTLHNVIQVVEEVPPSEFGEITITDYAKV